MSFALNQFGGFSLPASSGGGFSGPPANVDWLFSTDKSLTDSIASATLTHTRAQPEAGVAKYIDSAGDLIGVNADVARFTHGAVSPFDSLGFLVGGQINNKCVDSEGCGAGSWAKTNVVVSADTADFLGRTVADLVRPTTTSGLHSTKCTNAIIGVVGDAVNGFMFFKSAWFTNVKFKLQAGSGSSFEFFFDTDTGVIGDTAGTAPSQYGVIEFADGWWMPYIIMDSVTNATCSITAFVATGNSTGDDSFAPASGVEGILACGGQLTGHAILSSGSNSSYIPYYHGPTGTGLSDLDEDLVSIATGAWFNNTEGTLLIDCYQTAQQNTYNFNAAGFAGNPWTSTNHMWMRTDWTNGGGYGFIKATSTQFSAGVAGTGGPASHTAGRRKIALAYKLNDSQFAANGGVTAVDTSCTIPTVNTLRLNTLGSSVQFRGEAALMRVAYWNTRLTEAQLIELTTL